MKKTIFVYGLLGGVLIAGLKLIEYRFLVVEHSLEIYGGLVALSLTPPGRCDRPGAPPQGRAWSESARCRAMISP